jgi:hypothetical protein
MMPRIAPGEGGLKPHRLERHMASDDPNFETRAADNQSMNPGFELFIVSTRPIGA